MAPVIAPCCELERLSLFQINNLGINRVNFFQKQTITGCIFVEIQHISCWLEKFLYLCRQLANDIFNECNDRQYALGDFDVKSARDEHTAGYKKLDAIFAMYSRNHV